MNLVQILTNPDNILAVVVAAICFAKADDDVILCRPSVARWRTISVNFASFSGIPTIWSPLVSAILTAS